MLNHKNISIAIVVALSLALTIYGLNWWSDQREQSLRDSIANREGKIELLSKKVAEDSLKAIKLSHSVDSVLKLVHLSDTIIIKKWHEKEINRIVNLSADSSIALFTRYCETKKNSIR